MKIFFPVNVEWSAKNLWKMIPQTSRNKRYSGCILQIFIRNTFKTWNTVQKVMYFLFDFGLCSILSVKNRGLVTKVFVEIPLIKYLYSFRSNLKRFIHRKRTHICDVHLKNVLFLIIPFNYSN